MARNTLASTQEQAYNDKKGGTKSKPLYDKLKGVVGRLFGRGKKKSMAEADKGNGGVDVVKADNKMEYKTEKEGAPSPSESFSERDAQNRKKAEERRAKGNPTSPGRLSDMTIPELETPGPFNLKPKREQQGPLKRKKRSMEQGYDG